MKREPIIVLSVETLFSFQLPNLPLHAAGLPFINLSVKTVLNTEKILLIIWNVQKYYVEDVILILDMSSMMVQNLQENDFV